VFVCPFNISRKAAEELRKKRELEAKEREKNKKKKKKKKKKKQMGQYKPAVKALPYQAGLLLYATFLILIYFISAFILHWYDITNFSYNNNINVHRAIR